MKPKSPARKPPPPPVKACRACAVVKPLTEYHSNGYGSTRGTCKACVHAANFPRGFAQFVEDKYPPWLVLCSCSRCGRDLCARGQFDPPPPPRRSGGAKPAKPARVREPWYPEDVAGRVYSRPVCRRCLPFARREARPPETTFAIPSPE